MLAIMALPRSLRVTTRMALAGLLLSGCAVPFASPPVQVQAGASLRRLEGTVKESPSTATVASYRLVYPATSIMTGGAEGGIVARWGGG